MACCYNLFKCYSTIVRLIGTFTSQEKAVAAMKAYHLGDEEELQVEEWPTDEIATKFNIHVVAARSVDD